MPKQQGQPGEDANFVGDGPSVSLVQFYETIVEPIIVRMNGRSERDKDLPQKEIAMICLHFLREAKLGGKDIKFYQLKATGNNAPISGAATQNAIPAIAFSKRGWDKLEAHLLMWEEVIAAQTILDCYRRYKWRTIFISAMKHSKRISASKDGAAPRDKEAMGHRAGDRRGSFREDIRSKEEGDETKAPLKPTKGSIKPPSIVTSQVELKSGVFSRGSYHFNHHTRKLNMLYNEILDSCAELDKLQSIDLLEKIADNTLVRSKDLNFSDLPPNAEAFLQLLHSEDTLRASKFTELLYMKKTRSNQALSRGSQSIASSPKKQKVVRVYLENSGLVLKWICCVLNIDPPCSTNNARSMSSSKLSNPNEEQDLATFLRDGVALCKLVCAVTPKVKSCPLITLGPAFSIHRVVFFLEACRELGMQKKYLFSITDPLVPSGLDVEYKHRFRILRTLSVYSRQLIIKGYKGPYIDFKKAKLIASGTHSEHHHASAHSKDVEEVFKRKELESPGDTPGEASPSEKRLSISTFKHDEADEISKVEPHTSEVVPEPGHNRKSELSATSDSKPRENLPITDKKVTTPSPTSHKETKEPVASDAYHEVADEPKSLRELPEKSPGASDASEHTPHGPTGNEMVGHEDVLSSYGVFGAEDHSIKPTVLPSKGPQAATISDKYELVSSYDGHTTEDHAIKCPKSYTKFYLERARKAKELRTGPPLLEDNVKLSEESTIMHQDSENTSREDDMGHSAEDQMDRHVDTASSQHPEDISELSKGKESLVSHSRPLGSQRTPSAEKTEELPLNRSERHPGVHGDEVRKLHRKSLEVSPKSAAGGDSENELVSDRFAPGTYEHIKYHDTSPSFATNADTENGFDAKTFNSSQPTTSTESKNELAAESPKLRDESHTVKFRELEHKDYDSTHGSASDTHAYSEFSKKYSSSGSSRSTESAQMEKEPPAGSPRLHTKIYAQESRGLEQHDSSITHDSIYDGSGDSKLSPKRYSSSTSQHSAMAGAGEEGSYVKSPESYAKIHKEKVLGLGQQDPNSTCSLSANENTEQECISTPTNSNSSQHSRSTEAGGDPIAEHSVPHTRFYGEKIRELERKNLGATYGLQGNADTEKVFPSKHSHSSDEQRSAPSEMVSESSVEYPKSHAKFPKKKIESLERQESSYLHDFYGSGTKDNSSILQSQLDATQDSSTTHVSKEYTGEKRSSSENPQRTISEGVGYSLEPKQSGGGDKQEEQSGVAVSKSPVDKTLNNELEVKHDKLKAAKDIDMSYVKLHNDILSGKGGRVSRSMSIISAVTSGANSANLSLRQGNSYTDIFNKESLQVTAPEEIAEGNGASGYGSLSAQEHQLERHVPSYDVISQSEYDSRNIFEDISKMVKIKNGGSSMNADQEKTKTRVVNEVSSNGVTDATASTKDGDNSEITSVGLPVERLEDMKHDDSNARSIDYTDKNNIADGSAHEVDMHISRSPNKGATLKGVSPESKNIPSDKVETPITTIVGSALMALEDLSNQLCEDIEKAHESVRVLSTYANKKSLPDIDDDGLERDHHAKELTSSYNALYILKKLRTILDCICRACKRYVQVISQNTPGSGPTGDAKKITMQEKVPVQNTGSKLLLLSNDIIEQYSTFVAMLDTSNEVLDDLNDSMTGGSLSQCFIEWMERSRVVLLDILKILANEISDIASLSSKSVAYPTKSPGALPTASMPEAASQLLVNDARKLTLASIEIGVTLKYFLESCAARG